MTFKFCITLIAFSLLGLSSCKKGSAHAKPGEKADLLLVDDEGVVIGSTPNKVIEESNVSSTAKNTPQPEPANTINLPDSTPPATTNTPLNLVPKATPVEPNPETPIDPLFPSLASHQILESELSSSDYKSGNKRFADVKERATQAIRTALLARGLHLGDPVFIRVHKEEQEVELFILDRKTQKYKIAQTYNIAALSGELGPKLAEGDKQTPEGFYFVPLRSFNPSSRFHLSFNIGYPNKYDRSHNRTGSNIMMHGNTVSIGCYAMTDPVIEEIYTICHAALSSGNQRYFRFHSFPFKMTDENMERHRENPWFAFWLNLKQGYDFFQKHKVPPSVEVQNQQYYFSLDQ